MNSLREQLQVAGGVQTGSEIPSVKSQTSIFGRLGLGMKKESLRKSSILSLNASPHGASTARTFSLDDLIRPLPRRKLDLVLNMIVLKKNSFPFLSHFLNCLIHCNSIIINVQQFDTRIIFYCHSDSWVLTWTVSFQIYKYEQDFSNVTFERKLAIYKMQKSFIYLRRTPLGVEAKPQNRKTAIFWGEHLRSEHLHRNDMEIHGIFHGNTWNSIEISTIDFHGKTWVFI
jgi:hypothetical protein